MAELDPTTFRPETRALHSGQKPDPATNARAVPIYATTSYVFDDAAHAARLFGLQEFGNIYTRIMNPTTDVFEQRVAALEGGVAALGVASGQAAETLSILNLARAGDNIVSSSSPLRRDVQPVHPHPAQDRDHHDVRRRLRSVGVRSSDQRADQGRLPRADRQPAARRPRPRLDRGRRPRPGRPGHRRQHLRAAPRPADQARRGHRHPLGDQVDRRPRHRDRRRRRRRRHLRLGGQRALQGRTSSTRIRPTTGSATRAPSATSRSSSSCASRVSATSVPALSPFNAFLFLQGLETLPLRITRHSENALAVAKWLETRPEVTWVSYPGLESHPSHKLAKRYLTRWLRRRS